MDLHLRTRTPAPRTRLFVAVVGAVCAGVALFALASVMPDHTSSGEDDGFTVVDDDLELTYVDENGAQTAELSCCTEPLADRGAGYLNPTTATEAYRVLSFTEPVTWWAWTDPHNTPDVCMPDVTNPQVPYLRITGTFDGPGDLGGRIDRVVERDSACGEILWPLLGQLLPPGT